MKRQHCCPLIWNLFTACVLALFAQQASAQSVFINELHYDNDSTDAGEAIEIAGPAGTDLAGCSIVLYNGNNGTVYNTTALTGIIPDQQNGFGTVAISFPTNGIQNGSPDGIALTGETAVIQFLSYEGTFMAAGGPADGLLSTDIGVSEASSTAVGDSLQLGGTGAVANDFTWATATPNTFGAVNTGQAFSGTPSADNPCGGGDPGDPGAQGPFEIYEIQGAGDSSPFEGQLIETRDNVVTALAPDGFFMQTPATRSDGNVSTSDGIFVFTDSTPTVAVGDQIDVTAQVQEFFDFTELTGSPTVSVDGSGIPLPAAVTFDATVPSPDPATPSCAIEFECYEGMLIEIANGTVTGPNQRFGTDPVAEVHITAASERTFREPGVEFPGLVTMPDIPVWDGNPEVFELDPDKLGLPNLAIPAGSHFDAVGVLGFEFSGYELWPVSLSVSELPIPQPVRAREDGEFTVGSLNLFRLFDDIDDAPDTNTLGELRDDEVVSTAEYDRRRAKFVAYILTVLDAPDILAVEEAEKLGVLEDLAADIAAADPNVAYTAYLEEGNDIGTIDTGFLVRDTVAVDAVTQIGREEIFDFDMSALHDRPPLLLEGRVSGDNGNGDFPISVMAVHNRSLSGIDDTGSNEDRVRLKRLTQAQSIAAEVQEMQTNDPDLRLVIVGDFNAFEFTDGYVDAVGQIKGNFDPDENLLSGPDLVDPDLINQVLSIGVDERYSFIFRGTAQVLDHALTSVAIDHSVRGLEYGRGNTDAAVDLINDIGTPLRSSDHDGLVLYLTTDQDGDGVNDDADFCPAIVIPESVPTRRLGVNRWALTDDDFLFDTSNGTGLNFSTADTAGCSCAQIIAAQGLGNGHSKFGCSNGAMKNWVEGVGSL